MEVSQIPHSFHLLFTVFTNSCKEQTRSRTKETSRWASDIANIVLKYNMHLAENAALQMAALSKENATLIPWPAKLGASKKGFKLQVAMELKDNNELYATLHVSLFMFPYTFV